MDENTKKKMCWNCEGNVPLHEEMCPYCRASVLPIRSEDSSEAEENSEDQSSEGNGFVVKTMGLLMVGCFFFLFGFILYFFSVDGYFTLRWSDTYWYAYFIVSIPMLYFGWRNLSKIED